MSGVIEDRVSNVDYIRGIANLFSQRALGLGVTAIEVWGEPLSVFVTSAVAPPMRIRRRIEKERVDGLAYAVIHPQLGQPMRTYLVAAGRRALRDMHGAACDPSQLADGPVRLYFTWDKGAGASTVCYEVSLGQLADLLGELAAQGAR